jgi:hypothetical protein
MSWEEDFRRKYPCPCGEGEYEEVHYSDDWGDLKLAMRCYALNAKRNTFMITR